jgi:peptide/nickel transport system substrate-binding protein
MLRVLPAALGALALVLSACGGSSDKSAGGPKAPSGAAKKGGTLTVLSAADVDYIDPGLAYYTFSYEVTQATQRPLYAYKPDDPANPVPDLADGKPVVSKDGKTVTVHIKRGIRFSPPVNREVTSADVKYAMERAFTKNVPNGYATAYFNNIDGVSAFQKGAAKDISGIQTPDKYTLVFKLTSGGPFIGALVLPMTAPVPKSYAEKYDKQTPSQYGTHQVATGPYMVQNNRAGKLTGYQPGKRIVLVRNPNWSAKTDSRPAYLDKIVIDEGNTDATVASRRILAGSSMVSGDFAAPPEIIKMAISRYKDQINFTPGSGSRYIALNTKIAPFNNLNLRKAVLAATDRNALRLSRGGPVIGDIASHFIYPGVPGFEEAGGEKGTGVDFLANPSGDMKVATQYMKKAGYPTGKYTGPPILMVGANAGVGKAQAEVAQTQFLKLGFKVNLRLVTQNSLYTKFLGVPKAKVQVSPGVGWLRDFADPQTVLDPTFNGKNIQQVNNYNWPQLDDPQVNAAMDKAEKILDPKQRAKAWADIDRMVTALAPAVPWLWDKYPQIWSRNVQMVNDTWNEGSVDLSYTSLK